MNIKLCKIDFETDQLIKKDELKKIRGFLGNKFIDKTLIHNHIEEGMRYSYPLIQYKFLKDKFFIIGINEGADTLLSIVSQIDCFKIEEKIVNITKKNIEIWEEEIKLGTGYKIYKFSTPYFALNQKNFNIYNKLENKMEKKLFLNKILVGNILSFLKGVGIWADKEIICDIFFEDIKIINFKEQKMVGIKGEFAFNGVLPNFIGLGKSVSLGNGIIFNKNK
ncbi:MAG: hypothetical protein JXM74_08720 [Fusobacteriaceae bacterium]|nr:hypothetical protein [Fusobacteriaceae bacterium]MBN2838821.1 hypothetical protein [Fusobacteriaceae bacterium]